jgi:hypothetical protein
VDDAGSRAVGTEDDDSEPDSAFPEDDEDDTDDQGDDEEEHEAGRMRKKKKVTLSNKGKGVSAATVGDGEQDEHQDEQQEQEARQDDEQEDEQEPEEVLWDDDPMEAVHKIEALKRVAQCKIDALSRSSDAANRIDEIN